MKTEVQAANVEKELRLLAMAFQSTKEAIMITDGNGIIQMANPAFSAITGFELEEVVGKTPGILKSGQHNDEFYREFWNSLLDQGHWQGELWNRRKSGEVYPEGLSVTCLKDTNDQITNFVAVFSDISSQKLSEKRLQLLAQYNVITGLPNRQMFLERLADTITQAERTQTGLACLYLDLDRFQVINDNFGYRVGNQLLKEVGLRLSSSLGREHYVAYLTGDEFGVIVEESRPQEVENLTQRILNDFGQAFIVDGFEVFVNLSIGVSIYPTAGRDGDSLLKNAYKAVKFTKEKGSNCYTIYNPIINQDNFERLELEYSLHKALEREELQVHYQPQVELDSDQFTGVEALLRWQHPKLGMVSPGQFISLAEETGLIIPIGKWVLKSACLQTKAWCRKGLLPGRIAVNVSARQFCQKDFFDSVYRVIQETDANPEDLELEITESTAVQNVNFTIEILKKLQALGIQISIDDFGTGYSSLNYLKRFPIDKLKIDQSFVKGLTVSRDDEAIVTAIIAMAHKLGIKVIAEGVENTHQLDFLRARRCDVVQGYLFSRPVTKEVCTTLLVGDRYDSRESEVSSEHF